jgi:hypothetical protein
MDERSIDNCTCFLFRADVFAVLSALSPATPKTYGLIGAMPAFGTGVRCLDLRFGPIRLGPELLGLVRLAGAGADLQGMPGMPRHTLQSQHVYVYMHAYL